MQLHTIMQIHITNKKKEIQLNKANKQIFESQRIPKTTPTPWMSKLTTIRESNSRRQPNHLRDQKQIRSVLPLLQDVMSCS
jgi:hypothetical protein